MACVEAVFRARKSNLELRPIHVRLETSTRSHVLVVLLAYKIIKHLDQALSELYLTVEEGLRSLNTFTLQEVTVKGQAPFHQIPAPRLKKKKNVENAGY